jgi:hypothetical protein
MTPKRKILYLVCGLILPYWALAAYMVLRTAANPGHKLPPWLPLIAGYYLFGSILLVTILSRKISRNGALQNSKKPRPAPSWINAWAVYLIVIWSGSFLWGLYKTIIGDFPLNSAVLAGTLLLSFIGLFSWLWYRDYQARNQDTNS